MNKFEFLLNLDQYRNYKPKNVLYHDSYDIPKKETHKIQPGYSRAPKIYKDQISLYEEYNNEVIAHRGDMKYYHKIENFYGPGSHRYFYSKEEWDAYNNTKDKKPEYGIDETTSKMVKNNPDGSTFKTSITWDQFRNGSIMEADQKIERTLKESGMSAGIKAMMRDERIQEMLTQFEGGFENHGWEMDENGKVTGMNDEDKKYIQKMGQWMRKFKDSNGDYLFDSKEFQDTLNDEIRKRYDTIKDQKEQESEAQERNKKASDNDDNTNKYVNVAQENPKRAAKQILKNQDLGLYEAIAMIKYYMQNGYLQYKDGKFVTDNSDVDRGINQLLDEVQRQVNKVGDVSGTDRAIQKELDKLLQAKFQRMNDKYAV